MDKILYLYIKESSLGLKYMGKTVRDPYTYIGSGIYWTNHIKYHNLRASDICTEVIFSCIDKNEFRRKAIEYSNIYNIVESKEWANIVVECGEGTLGFKHTTEAKIRITKAVTGRKHSIESRQKMSNICKGRIVARSHIEKLKLLNTGRVHTQEMRDKVSKANKGRIVSEETRMKLSKINKGRKLSKEQIDRLRLCNIGRIQTEETKLKRNLKLKGRIVTEETRNRLSMALMGKIVSQSAKDNMSESKKTPIIMLSAEGIYIREFDSAKAASIFLGVAPCTLVSNNLNNKTKTCKGYIFVRKEEYDINKDYTVARGNTRAIEKYSKDGELLQTYLSIRRAEDEIGIPGCNSNITACCKGKKRNAYGFIWKYKN